MKMSLLLQEVSSLHTSAAGDESSKRVLFEDDVDKKGIKRLENELQVARTNIVILSNNR